MSGNPNADRATDRLNTDRRSARRNATKAEIVAAAWSLAREHGLGGIAMRDLGALVGMRAQSIYSYFASKHDIYDAMFHEGYLQFAAEMSRSIDVERLDADPKGQAQSAAHAFVSFCTDDPTRFQLLFQRTIPGFEPSAESYAVALASYQEMTDRLAAIGVEGQDVLDLWTAVLTGLASQQISNDPGGSRWTQLVDDAVDLLLAHHDNQATSPSNSTDPSNGDEPA